MAVTIGQIVTETVVSASGSARDGSAPAGGDEDIEVIVRRATERVLETLRREWDG